MGGTGDIMLSEISQSHKDKYYLFSLNYDSWGETKQNNQSHESTRDTSRGRGKAEERERIQRVIEVVNMIKVHCVHIWKCHD
jgi:dihydroorotase-like cyclic amidohydrolase